MCKSPKPQSFRLNELCRRNQKQTISIRRLSWKNCFIYCSVPMKSLRFERGKSYYYQLEYFFSDRIDIFWLSVFVKLFKRKVKFRHNRLHAHAYTYIILLYILYIYMSTCAARIRVWTIKSTSVFVPYNKQRAQFYYFNPLGESSPPYSRAVYI